MFGIDPKAISFATAALNWVIQSIQLIAKQLGVKLPDPPQYP